MVASFAEDILAAKDGSMKEDTKWGGEERQDRESDGTPVLYSSPAEKAT